MKLKMTLVAATLALTFGLSSAAARADDVVTITINNANQYISSPGTLTYNATVTASASNSDVVWLNGGNVNFSLPNDDTDFFTNYPFFLNPGDSFTGDLFTVTVPDGSTVGTSTGTFELEGGPDGGSLTDLDNLDTVNFTTTVTPEPSSFLLLGTGLVGAFTTLKKKRFGRV